MRVSVVTAAGDEVVGASLVLVAVATAAGLAAGLAALRTRRGGGDGGGGGSNAVGDAGGPSGESLSLMDDGGEGELVDGDPLDHHTFLAWGTPRSHAFALVIYSAYRAVRLESGTGTSGCALAGSDCAAGTRCGVG